MATTSFPSTFLVLVKTTYRFCVPLPKVAQCNIPICAPFAELYDNLRSQYGDIAFQFDQTNKGSQHGTMSKQRKSALKEHNGTGHHLEGLRVDPKNCRKCGCVG